MNFDLARRGPGRSAKAGLLAGLFCCAIFSAAAIWKIWPPLDGDAPATFPTAVEISEGRPMKILIWLSPFPSTLDQPNGDRFISHGFLYPSLVGWIGRLLGGGPHAVIAGMYFINLTSAFLVAYGLLKRAPPAVQLSPILGAILGMATFSLTISWAGRIEPMVFLFVGAALSVVPKGGISNWVVPSGMVVLIGFASPVYGVGGALFAFSYFCLKQQSMDLRICGQVLAGLGGALLIGTFVYPYPLLDWVEGVLLSRRGVLSQSLGQGFFPAWIKNFQIPGLIFVFGILAAGVMAGFGRLVAQSWKTRPLRSLLSAISALAFGVFIARMSLGKSEAAYNAIGWLPLFLAVIYQTSRSALLPVAATFAMILPVIGLARTACLLGNQFRPEAVAFEELQSEIDARVNEGVLVAPAFFLACRDPWAVEFDDMRGRPGTKPTWFIDKQVNRGIQKPREIPGYHLALNRFGPEMRIFALPISRTPGGWEYAVYRRADLLLPEASR